MSEETALQVVAPAMAITDFTSHIKSVNDLVKKQMKEDQDYGVIPGTQKKTLYDPGAEKLGVFFGLTPEYEILEQVQDWEKGFFFYKVKCSLTHFKSGKFAGSAIRACNSMEKKYGFSQVNEKWATDQQKLSAVSKFTKKEGNWTNTYLKIKRSPEEQADQVNTILSMAQKRAFVEAVRTATMASEIFSDGKELEQNEPAQDSGSGAVSQPPYRNTLLAALFASGAERGFSQEQIKKSVYKKYNVDSVTSCTDEQLEAFKELLITTYRAVGKGHKPEKFGATSITEVNEGKAVDEIKQTNSMTYGDGTGPAIEGQIVDSTTEPLPWETEKKEEKKAVYYCKGPKHDKDHQVAVDAIGGWCSKECQNEYFGDDKKGTKQSRFDDFLKKGKEAKAEEEI